MEPEELEPIKNSTKGGIPMIAVGIDVSKSKSTVAILNSDGTTLVKPYTMLHTQADMCALADCHASNYSSHLRQIYRRLNSAAPLHYLYLRAVFYGTFFSVLLTILSDSLIVSFATENKKRKNSPDQSSFFLSTTSAVSRFLAGSMS